MLVNMGIFPNFRGENKKSLKPPPSFLLLIYLALSRAWSTFLAVVPSLDAGKTLKSLGAFIYWIALFVLCCQCLDIYLKQIVYLTEFKGHVMFSKPKSNRDLATPFLTIFPRCAYWQPYTLTRLRACSKTCSSWSVKQTIWKKKNVKHVYIYIFPR